MFWIITAFIAGYATAIFTWPKLRTLALGAGALVATLRDKARALHTRIKTLVGS